MKQNDVNQAKDPMVFDKKKKKTFYIENSFKLVANNLHGITDKNSCHRRQFSSHGLKLSTTQY